MKFANLNLNVPEKFALLDYFFEEWIPSKKGIYVFGMGEYGKAMRNFLLENGVRIKAFIESAPKCKYSDTGEQIISIDEYKYRHETSNAGGVIMAISSTFFATPLFAKLYFAYDDIFFFETEFLELVKAHCGKRVLMRASWAITEHCNLSCYSCQIAAPVAQKSFYDFNDFKLEIDVFRELCADKMFYLGITSAEPLLHPQFFDFILYARKRFPEVKLHVITNGLLLYKQEDAFWKKIAELNVVLTWTKYPVKYSADPLIVFEAAAKHNATLTYVEDSYLGNEKESWELLSDCEAKAKTYDYLLCPFHNSCITVSRGRLFTCNRYAVSEHCSERFGVNLPVSAADYLDLHKAKSSDEIMDFVIKRPPLCNYCLVRENRSLGEWKPSEKMKKEWIRLSKRAAEEKL